MFMEKISAIPKPEIGVRILLSQEVGVKKHNEDFFNSNSTILFIHVMLDICVFKFYRNRCLII